MFHFSSFFYFFFFFFCLFTSLFIRLMNRAGVFSNHSCWLTRGKINLCGGDETQNICFGRITRTTDCQFIPSFYLISRQSVINFIISSLFSLFFFSHRSLMPLMMKDGLVIPMLAVTLLYACIFLSLYSSKLIKCLDEQSLAAKLAALALNTSIFGHAILMSLFLLKPPKRYPDLYTVIYSTWSASHFIMFFLMLHLLQFYHQENNALMKTCEIVESLIRKVPRARASQTTNGKLSACKKNK